MPKIINTFKTPDPTGQAIARLGKSFFGDQASGALKRERLRAAERKNVDTGNLSNLIFNEGAHNLGASPIAQALMASSGFSPTKFNAMNLMGNATTHGARGQQTQNAQVGSGQPFRNTAEAFDATQATSASNNAARIAESARQFDELPVETMINGQTGFTNRNQVTLPTEFGDPIQPIPSLAQSKGIFAANALQTPEGIAGLNAPEQSFIGAQPSSGGSVFNYVAPGGQTFITRDGVTDAQSGQPLPPGGFKASVQGGIDETGVGDFKKAARDLLSSRNNTDIAVNMIGSLREKLKSPDSGVAIGALGAGARLFNDARAQLEALSQVSGGIGFADDISRPEVKASIDQGMNALMGDAATQDAMQRLGIDASILRSRIQDLAYVIAKAQGGPGDRISEPDVERAIRTIGGSLQDPAAMDAVLAELSGNLTTQQSIRERNTTQMFPDLGVQPRDGSAPPLVPQDQPAQNGAPVPWQQFFPGAR